MWLELELDRLFLSARRPPRPLPWPTTAEVETVRELGFVDPVTVRAIPATRPTRYEIVSGEKQWLAAQQAGLPKIAAFVRDGLDDEEVRRLLSLPTERVPSNPIQEARALQQQVQPDHVRFEARLSEQLGVPVTVEYARDGAGRLILAFSDLEILDGLLERLGYCDDAD